MVKRLKKELTPAENSAISNLLQERFAKNMARHKGLEWNKVLATLEGKKAKLWSLNEMEITGGEPDVIGQEVITGGCVFYDCSAETPKGRKSTCYDPEGLESRKDAKPGNSALGMARDMGIYILTEEAYRMLQQFGNFDSKTSSWIETPGKIRKLGGALFADFRYGHVFVYHNGAESYYSSRGFRGFLRV